MKYLFLCFLGILSAGTEIVCASHSEDIQLYRHYFLRRFPGIHVEEFANGAYAIDRKSRDNWLAIEEFPSYYPLIDEGEAMWRTPFSNGLGYVDCFNGNPAQKKHYPRWDKEQGKVVTLPLAINDYRRAKRKKKI